MLAYVRELVKRVSSKKGVKITLAVWVIALIALTVFAPSAGDYEQNSEEASISGDRPSEIASHLKDQEFPSDDGLTALMVFHRDGGLNDQDKEKLTKLSEWLASDDRPEDIASALPFHEVPEEVQDKMISEDGTTLLFNATFKEGVDSDLVHNTLDKISNKVDSLDMGDVQFEITGPAGIAADTIAMFKNGDFVLMIGTIVLIFIILILIYRSPILAITPLIIAGLVYGVVDRLLGIAGKYELFEVNSSAVSIMLVLLFAVVTDYSLFIFSRYREELEKTESKYESMSKAIYHVSEPIFFSGGTIFLAMLTLFATVFEPYHAFASVFSVSVAVILIAGLTLIPSVFAIMGRKAFWPSIPKANETSKKSRHKFWGGVGHLVKKRSGVIAAVLVVIMGIGIYNVTQIDYSFNQLKSFPEDMSSRKGFELLEEHYPAGELAPVNVIVQSDDTFDNDTDFRDHISSLIQQLESAEQVDSVSPGLSDAMVKGDEELPRDFLAESKRAVKLQLTLSGNPYEPEALDAIEDLRENEGQLLTSSGFSTKSTSLHYSGQTAQQLDVRHMNERDTIVLFAIVIVLIVLVLAFQTRSLLMAGLMVGTILLSFGATLGFSWWMFEHLMGYDSISYRLPVYTFVFMVALGVDYNIMLVSRIREYAKTKVWKDAVEEGVKMTGGVISSAGLILAATFAVLMSQPIQELFLFGFAMAFGILLDTFIVRGFLMPSLLNLTHREK
ncbi:putative membrane protein [Lentibacillus sp. JNUCC-1]|uniref:MMPL family transporter n=1 Tax=Lentibacillus sp. JNUCC-1 TaxID=2654513 RepID=UPI0012E8F1E2|nr:MMPL family transporter [Lentibacillus sp. JNUCC-1]MUV36391.1 putative membrane protein [Lentibacillus sp. JNUCC-1]